MSLIASTAKGSADGIAVTTDPIDTTGAGFIAICRSNYVAGLTPTDSYGNTWTGHGAQTDTAGGVTEWFTCNNPIVGPGHTFSLTGAPNTRKPTLNVLAFSGTVVLDDDDGNGLAGVTSIQPVNSITPAQASSLLLTACTFENADTLSADPAFTKVNQVDYDSSNHIGVAVAYEIQTVATNRQPTWSWTTSGRAATNFAVFAYTAPSTALILGSTFIGAHGRIRSTRTVLMSCVALAASPKVVNKPGGVTVDGYLDVTGTTTVTDLVVTGSATGVSATVADDSVTNAKLANMAQATIKGRADGAGTGDPSDLTANQVSTILDAATDPFVRTSAIPGGAGDLDGLSDVVISSPATNQVLSYNGSSWVNSVVPAGSADSRILTTVKASDTSRNSTTTPTDDPHLTLSVAANKTYMVDLTLLLTAANATMDMKLQWSVPTGAAIYWGGSLAGGGVIGWNPPAPTTSPSALNTTGSAVVGTFTSNPFGVWIRGVLVVAGTAGTLAFQWSQNTSDGGDLTVKAGSTLVAITN